MVKDSPTSPQPDQKMQPPSCILYVTGYLGLLKLPRSVAKTTHQYTVTGYFVRHTELHFYLWNVLQKGAK